MKNKMENKLLLSLLLAITFVGSVSAQNYRTQDYRSQDYVTIFEDCDYRGKSRDIYVGEFNNMDRVDFGNDRISSIQVPQGFQVTIYEDDDYRGDYARVDRNVSCFDKSWNDKVSSLRVQQTGRPDYSNNQPRYDNNRSNNRYDQTPTARSNANAQNVSYVAFAGRVLQQTSSNQWEMINRKNQRAQLTETARDKYAVYLENQYSGQRVRIDFFADEVTVVNRNDQQQRYKMDRHYSVQPSPNYNQTVNNGYNPPNNNVVQGNIINGRCFDIKAYSDGGSAGLRFSSGKAFYRYNSKPHTGRICHTGELKVEISKRDPQTSVVLEINGRPYTFSKNEKHDLLKASWYRKNLTLFVRP